MISRRLIGLAAVGATALLGSCSNRSERNIITDRSPFFHGTVPYSQSETGRIISSVRRFADANGMDFLLSQDGPDMGDYNAHAAGHDLNLQAIHTRAISRDTTDIYAVSRSAPTEADKAKVRQFVCAVRGECRS